MCAAELWDIQKGHFLGVWLVQSHTKVSLPAQEEHEKDSNMQHAHQGCREEMCSGKGEGGEWYMWRGEWVGGVYREEEGRRVMWEACEVNVYMCTVRRVYLYDCVCVRACVCVCTANPCISEPLLSECSVYPK